MNPPTASAMSNISIVTPSYWADHDLVERLAQSMDRHFKFAFNHFIVISRRDRHLFAKMAGPHRRIIFAEDILRPFGFRRIPLPRRIRLPLFGERRYREQWHLPGAGRVGGWTVQQIIKIAAADFTRAETIVFADSDIEIIRDVTADRFVRDGRVLLHEHSDVANNPRSATWRRHALHVLGLPQSADRGFSYVGNLIAWDRQTLIDIRRKISANGSSWWLQLAKIKDVSEYMIYGTYVKNLENDQRHIVGNHDLYYSIWDEANLGRNDALKDTHVAVHLQSVLPIGDGKRKEIIAAIKCKLEVL